METSFLPTILPTVKPLPAFRALAPASRRPLPRRPTIRTAITRGRKEDTVAAVREQLEWCYFLASIRYEGLTVKQLQSIRDALPKTCRLLMAKNTLVGKAIEGTPWEVLKLCMKGMNAWLFVHTEEVPASLKPYRAFQKEEHVEDTNDFVGAVFEGKFYGPGDFKVLETMPSRAEVYANLLSALQGPATSVANQGGAGDGEPEQEPGVGSGHQGR